MNRASSVKPYAGTDTVLRTRIFRVEFLRAPDSPAFSGLLTATVAWPGGSRLNLDVFGQFRGGISAAPSRIVLGPAKPSVAVMLIAEEALDAIEFEVEAPPGLTLDVQPDHPAAAARVRKFTIALVGKRPAQAEKATVRFRRPGSRTGAAVSVSIESQ